MYSELRMSTAEHGQCDTIDIRIPGQIEYEQVMLKRNFHIERINEESIRVLPSASGRTISECHSRWIYFVPNSTISIDRETVLPTARRSHRLDCFLCDRKTKDNTTNVVGSSRYLINWWHRWTWNFQILSIYRWLVLISNLIFAVTIRIYRRTISMQIECWNRQLRRTMDHFKREEYFGHLPILLVLHSCS